MPVPTSSSFTISAVDARGQLVERIAQSRYIAKSARLHDLLLYLCGRVIDEGADEIHEQEVGHAVFGRPAGYDTAADNIVRVHASTLRKRLEQFFAEEGIGERLIVELPKGNYAPFFRERPAAEPATAALQPAVGRLPEVPPEALPVIPPREPVAANARLRAAFVAASVLAAVFACTTLFLLFLLRTSPKPSTAPAATLAPAVRAFWSGVFAAGQKTSIILDDAALGLYQEIDGRPIALSEYFDRSYQRRPGGQPALASLLLKRQSSYANVTLLAQFGATSAALGSGWTAHFARDYTFRDLKNSNAILLGNSRSNPWIEPFENRLGLRWFFDAATGLYYPSDTWAQGDYRPSRQSATSPDGYATIALLPNLGGTGNIMILSGTGGAATAAAAAFLADAGRMSELRGKLPAGKNGNFPAFEALIRIPSRSRLPQDAEIVIDRLARN